MKYIYTKDYLIQKLQQKAKELGRTPTTKDMRKPYPSCRKYYEVYKSWNNTLFEAGLIEEFEIEMYKGYHPSSGKKIKEHRKNK